MHKSTNGITVLVSPMYMKTGRMTLRISEFTAKKYISSMNKYEKIRILRLLVKEYSQYLDRWNKGSVRYDRFNNVITVTFYREIQTTNEYGMPVTLRPNHQIPFGPDALDERIKSYRDKIRYAKSKVQS